MRHGWYWGTQAFGEKLWTIAERAIRRGRNRENAPIIRTHDEKEAQRIVLEGLAHLGLHEDELAATPGSDRRKLEIAASVHAKTAVPMKWIAARLKMRSAANASQQLRRFRRSDSPGAEPGSKQRFNLSAIAD